MKYRYQYEEITGPLKGPFISEYDNRYFLIQEFFFVYFLLPRRKYLCSDFKERKYIKERNEGRQRWIKKKHKRATFFKWKKKNQHQDKKKNQHQDKKKKPSGSLKKTKTLQKEAFNPKSNNLNNKFVISEPYLSQKYAKLIDNCLHFTNILTKCRKYNPILSNISFILMSECLIWKEKPLKNNT